MGTRAVEHPRLGHGTLVRTYMGGFEWEVQFESGRRFRLPAREFAPESVRSHQPAATVSTYAPRITLPETDTFRAKQTLESLRVGIVPVQDVETLTIGLESERVSLERALARSRERGGDVEAIIGDYGYGKSHFVELAARRALREQFIVASASLDLVEVPPGKAYEIYRTLVGSLRYPGTDERGLRPLLRAALDRGSVVDEFVALSPRGNECPLARTLLALRDCNSQQGFDDIVQWISGQINPTYEMKVWFKKPPRLYRTGEVARQYIYLLTSISVLATMVGYSGLAVLIDESEHYSLLRATQRQRADAFFTGMIYAALGPTNGKIDARTIPSHPRADYELTFKTNPNLFFLFALTESENRMPVDLWLTPSQTIRLDDRFIERDIGEFFGTLLRYHAIAYDYGDAITPERYAQIASTVPNKLARALGQHRINLREVIRISVIVLDLVFLHPDYVPETLLDELASGLRV